MVSKTEGKAFHRSSFFINNKGNGKNLYGEIQQIRSQQRSQLLLSVKTCSYI